MGPVVPVFPPVPVVAPQSEGQLALVSPGSQIPFPQVLPALPGIVVVVVVVEFPLESGGIPKLTYVAVFAITGKGELEVDRKSVV